MLQIWERMGWKRELAKKGERWAGGAKTFSPSYVATDLMLMRYWARATDSQFPLMVIVRSRLAGASLSSQLEIRIIAPLICLMQKNCFRFVSDLQRKNDSCGDIIGQCLSQTRWTWVSQIILMFTAVAGNTIWHIVPLSSLRGIFCVSQIICEALGC